MSDLRPRAIAFVEHAGELGGGTVAGALRRRRRRTRPRRVHHELRPQPSHVGARHHRAIRRRSSRDLRPWSLW